MLVVFFVVVVGLELVVVGLEVLVVVVFGVVVLDVVVVGFVVVGLTVELIIWESTGNVTGVTVVTGELKTNRAMSLS